MEIYKLIASKAQCAAIRRGVHEKDIDDIVQESVRRLLRYKEHTASDSYINRVVENVCNDYYRKGKKQEILQEELQSKFEQELILNTAIQQYHITDIKILDKDKDFIENLIECRYDFKKLAEEMQISTNAVYKRYYKILKRLRTINETIIS